MVKRVFRKGFLKPDLKETLVRMQETVPAGWKETVQQFIDDDAKLAELESAIESNMRARRWGSGIRKLKDTAELNTEGRPFLAFLWEHRAEILSILLKLAALI